MKAWHSQQPRSRDLRCPACLKDDCEHCADVLLARVGRSIGCTCGRDRHARTLAAAQQGAVGLRDQEELSSAQGN